MAGEAKISRYQIRKMERRADTILRKARELAFDVNEAWGYEHHLSDFAEDVVCTAETLGDALLKRAGGQLP